MSDMPYGAREIADARAAGKKPAHMVIVSLIGPLREQNPVVIASTKRSYDWRFLVDLDVLIVIDSRTEKHHVKRIIDSLTSLPTRYLGVWVADQANGFHVAWGKFKPRSSTMRAMGRSERKSFFGIGGV